jgi:hypothetical protein
MIATPKLRRSIPVWLLLGVVEAEAEVEKKVVVVVVVAQHWW